MSYVSSTARRLTLAATLGLAAVPQAHAFSPTEKAAIEQIVQQYILEHPEIIPQAMHILQNRITAAAIEQNKAALFNDPESMVIGNLKGDVTIVEFFDYTCVYCKMMTPFLERLIKEDKGVKIVFKEWPVRGPVAEIASRAAIASRDQGKYMAFHNALFARPGNLSEAGIYETAAKVGLDVERLKKDMLKPAVSKIIEQNRALGGELDLRGTPAFIIGETLIPSAMAYDELVAQVKAARSAKPKK